MAFLSFLGRLLFVSVFILSAYQEFNEFGVDGGAAANALGPKFNVFSKHVTTHTGLQVPHIEACYIVRSIILNKLFLPFFLYFCFQFFFLFQLLHQVIVTPILYDFYNYDADKKEFVQLFVKFTQGLQLIGALLFFVGMKNSMPRRPTKKAAKTKTN
nr:uncharacterized protein LOC109175711 [Ipomoea trifida]